MNCRFCSTPLSHVFLDLGFQASANCFLSAEQLNEPEPLYPLKVYVCESCWLVQLGDIHAAGNIFKDDYVYYSSYSEDWVEHARRYVEEVSERFSLDRDSFAVEVASNDGYLLQHFVNKGVPCLGIDPADHAAKAAKEKGVETLVAFFNTGTAAQIADERGQADLIAANNVLAHVPDVNGFVEGFRILLKSGGVLTLEFPHLARLIAEVQFDTIYDEHYSYFSFTTARTILARHGLEVFDVDKLSTHGGSVRIFARHKGGQSPPATPAVRDLLDREREWGMASLDHYLGFQKRVEAISEDFKSFIREEKDKGSSIAAFGAAAKGNTFLNYCGIGADVIDFVSDDTPAKQGKFLPQSRIPVLAEEAIGEKRPDVVLILPWNVKMEIMKKLDYIREWGGRFVTCIPEVRVS